MDILWLLRITNTVISLLSCIPIFMLIRIWIKDRIELPQESRPVSTALLLFFILLFVVTLITGLSYFYTLLTYYEWVRPVDPIFINWITLISRINTFVFALLLFRLGSRR